MYLEHFAFPGEDLEYNFFLGMARTCYDSFYPFQVLTKIGFDQLDFEPITILYGGNGCGKTTVLNVIAEKLQLLRDSAYNRSCFMGQFVDWCRFRTTDPIPPHSRIITSDDVFDYMLNLRALNEGIDSKREDLFQEFLDAKYSNFQLKSLEDYEQLKRVNYARSKSKTQSKYIRANLMGNIKEKSNGESAFQYFVEKIQENALYLLDEPENSLSAERQLELVKFLDDSARFFGCQFIISTHSPFLLSLKRAKIYDMDSSPVDIRQWTELKNVRIFYDFFKKHEEEFD